MNKPYKKNPMHYNISVRYRFLVISRLLKLRPDTRLLDVGCGLGYMAARLADKCTLTGIDIDKESIEYAKKQDSKSRYMVVDFSKGLPFKNNTFDYIVSSEVIEHVEDDVAFMKELSRVLKPDGKVIITTPSSEGIIKISELCHTEGHEKHHKDYYSEKDLRKVFSKAGLRLTDIKFAMILFSQMFMEMTKLAYSKKNKEFSKQSDILKENKSMLFRLYKIGFFVGLVLMMIDEILSVFMKGSDVVVIGKKTK